MANDAERLFSDYMEKRDGLLKAITGGTIHDNCDPDKEPLCLYGLFNEIWDVRPATEEALATDIPEAKLRLLNVAVHCDIWLLGLAHHFANTYISGDDNRERFIKMTNKVECLAHVVSMEAIKKHEDTSLTMPFKPQRRSDSQGTSGQPHAIKDLQLGKAREQGEASSYGEVGATAQPSGAGALPVPWEVATISWGPADPPWRYAAQPMGPADPPWRYAAQPMGYAAQPMGPADMPWRYAAPPMGPAAQPMVHADLPWRYAGQPMGPATPPMGYAAQPMGPVALPWRYAAPPMGPADPPWRYAAPPMEYAAQPTGYAALPWRYAAQQRVTFVRPWEYTAQARVAAAQQQQYAPVPRAIVAVPNVSAVQPRDSDTLPQGATAQPRGDAAKPSEATKTPPEK